MAVPTKNDIAEALWNSQNSFPFAEAKKTDQKRYLDLAESLGPIMDATYREGVDDAVSEAEYLTGMVEGPVEGIYNNLGLTLPNPLG